MSLPNGKISLKLMNTDNKNFTETPFYTNLNFMSETPVPGQPSIDRSTAMSRFNQAMAEINDLTTNDYQETIVTYECHIEG